MKVLILNGSPRKDGNTTIAVNEVEKTLKEEGLETEVIQIGTMAIRGCIGCEKCSDLGRCVFNDIVNEVAEKFQQADGLVVASPVYWGSANGSLVSLLDRLFYSTSFSKSMKVGASIAVARRAGTTATYDELNKYFTISGMPIAPSQYWNNVFGSEKGEANQDEEGLQIMRTLARNMAFMIKSIDLGKKEFGLPEREKPRKHTNFIR